MRQLAFDVFAGADKVLCVVVMLFDTGGDGKDIGSKISSGGKPTSSVRIL